MQAAVPQWVLESLLGVGARVDLPISVLSVVGVACVCGSGPVTHFEGARYRVVPVRVALLPSPSEGPLCQL